ncbi:MAG: hypothetical protein SFV19_10935 [Rhodospirillaceae bacterium]|nr:hypothetical protein [Rhodospirillaceae bacterium]
MVQDKDTQPGNAVPDVWRAKVAGTLINPDTLLATDYMNHFNEVVMLIEMLPDMPDMLPDCAAWQSKSYTEHFLNSGLDYGPLAAEAFKHLPSSIKVPFDLTVAQLNAVIGLTIKRAAASISIGDTDEMRRSVGAGIAVMRKLTETLAGIINGSKQTMDQDEIDAMLGAANDDASAKPAGGAQDDIDKLFG